MIDLQASAEFVKSGLLLQMKVIFKKGWTRVEGSVKYAIAILNENGFHFHLSSNTREIIRAAPASTSPMSMRFARVVWLYVNIR